jgi:hypothetical protein
MTKTVIFVPFGATYEIGEEDYLYNHYTPAYLYEEENIFDIYILEDAKLFFTEMLGRDFERKKIIKITDKRVHSLLHSDIISISDKYGTRYYIYLNNKWHSLKSNEPIDFRILPLLGSEGGYAPPFQTLYNTT